MRREDVVEPRATDSRSAPLSPDTKLITAMRPLFRLLSLTACWPAVRVWVGAVFGIATLAGTIHAQLDLPAPPDQTEKTSATLNPLPPLPTVSPRALAPEVEAGAWAEAEAEGEAAQAPSVDALLARGEVHDRKFEAAQALKYYREAEKLEPENPRVLLRIARQHRHLMADAAAEKEKLRLGRIALEYARRAAAVAPDTAEAHLSVAITLGKMLPILKKKEQVAASPQIKSAVDRSLQLDPKNDLAWHILGRWHRVLAEVGGVKRALAGAIFGGLPKGSNEEAAKALERAIALNPKRLMHHIELGRVYAQMGRRDEARRLIERGLAMRNTEKDDPETKERGRETLRKLR